VELHFRPHRIKDAVPLLEKGEIDFAAGVLSNFNEHIRAVPLDTLHYVGVIRHDHPLGPSPSAEEFLAARHIVVSLSGGPALIDVELAERGLKRRVALVVNQFGSVDRMIAETDMVTIVPTKVVLDSPYRDRLTMLQLPFNVEPRVVSLVWHERSDESREHRWLREQLLRRPGGSERVDTDSPGSVESGGPVARA
jgi:DNA-binding transcriptional LysR family regulator